MPAERNLNHFDHNLSLTLQQLSWPSWQAKESMQKKKAGTRARMPVATSWGATSTLTPRQPNIGVCNYIARRAMGRPLGTPLVPLSPTGHALTSTCSWSRFDPQFRNYDSDCQCHVTVCPPARRARAGAESLHDANGTACRSDHGASVAWNWHCCQCHY